MNLTCARSKKLHSPHIAYLNIFNVTKNKHHKTRVVEENEIKRFRTFSRLIYRMKSIFFSPQCFVGIFRNIRTVTVHIFRRSHSVHVTRVSPERFFPFDHLTLCRIYVENRLNS